MTRLLMAGFETGDDATWGSDAFGGFNVGTVGVVSATPLPRSGTYCLKCASGSGSLNSLQFYGTYRESKAFAHASKTELWYAFGFYAHHAQEGAAPLHVFFAAKDTAGNVNTLLALDSGVIRAYFATAGGATPSALTLIAAASASMALDTWHLIEVRLVAATGSTGNCEVYLDGTAVISTSSQRTAQTNANFGSFDLGWISGPLPTGILATGTYHAFDDVRVQDTSGSVNNARPGDGRILPLLPTGAGTTIGGTPLSRGGTDTGANWSQVSELPPSMTQYNTGTVTGTGETYALADPVNVLACQAVNVICYADNADGGGGSIGITTKTAAGTSEGSALPITGTPTYYNRLLETDPADSAAWTSAKLIALEAGITVR